MSQASTENLDYNRPVKIADDVYWVGFSDPVRGLHCNPYLIVDGKSSVLIDGGSRPDFSTVMRKILQTGIDPSDISYLVYQHYDPDLCGSIPNLEDIINRPDLQLISKEENLPFIRHYSVHCETLCIDQMERQLTLASGRTLRFFPTPYAHAAGSFVTYDDKTGILFTSDLFGSFSTEAKWKLFLKLDPACSSCEEEFPDDLSQLCPKISAPCPWTGIEHFHRQLMPSNRALRNAMRQVRRIEPKVIAPQHGSVLIEAEDIEHTTSRLMALEGVGIDGIDDGG